MEIKTTYRKTDFVTDTYLMDWFGENLPDAKNYFVTDLDIIIRTRRGDLMLLEIKRKMSAVKNHQSITFQMLDRALKQADGKTIPVNVGRHNFNIKLRYQGLHLVQFENTTFEDGLVYLDGRATTEQKLIDFLSFKNVDLA